MNKKKKLRMSKSATWSLYWRARKGLSESPKPFKSGATTQLEPLRPRSCNLGVKICKGSTLLQQLAEPIFMVILGIIFCDSSSLIPGVRQEKRMEKPCPHLTPPTVPEVGQENHGNMKPCPHLLEGESSNCTRSQGRKKEVGK